MGRPTCIKKVDKNQQNSTDSTKPDHPQPRSFPQILNEELQISRGLLFIIDNL